LLERNRRESRLSAAGAGPWEIGSVAILGAGQIGVEITADLLRHGLPVVLVDRDPAVLASAPDRVLAELGAATSDQDIFDASQAARRLTCTMDPARLADCGAVIESIVENAIEKQKAYRDLEPWLAEGAIVLSNTSTIPIARLAEGMTNPERFCGVHFFHPVRRRTAVELIRGPRTSQQTVAKATRLITSLGKLPVAAGDGPGFIGNRLLLAYLGEAPHLLTDGAPMAAVERAAVDFGMGLGPLRYTDEIGLETIVAAGRVLWRAFPARVAPSPLFITMYKSGRRGRKTSAGFFSYPPGGDLESPGQADPEVQRLIDQWAARRQEFTPEEIVYRLLFPMVIEATRLLEEGIAGSPGDIDLASIFALGFPACRGGLLWWADALGARQIVDRLALWATRDPRMEPTPMLLEMAGGGGRFYREDKG
jgi:3-hydroxyacyl-CoA dehydrogenase/enoyl-CoA hydratase/3-hydroxybutyryl-CoA epimerase/3-hydroxyacyl-CoA dehydrogenase/enoyl-CoA hydratase/3-hydroxybutyryl-CoA epimerase/enoyl-CoA isomerase